MKKYIAMVALGLSACGPVGDGHHPKLASQPKDMAKYEANRQTCMKETGAAITARIDRGSANTGAYSRTDGVTGYVIGNVSKEEAVSYYDSPSDMTDRCMKAKGYDVVMQ